VFDDLTHDDILFLLVTNQVSEQELASQLSSDDIVELEERALEIICAKNNVGPAVSNTIH